MAREYIGSLTWHFQIWSQFWLCTFLKFQLNISSAPICKEFLRKFNRFWKPNFCKESIKPWALQRRSWTGEQLKTGEISQVVKNFYLKPYNKPTVKYPVYLDHKYVCVRGVCTYGDVHTPHTHTYIFSIFIKVNAKLPLQKNEIIFLDDWEA